MIKMQLNLYIFNLSRGISQAFTASGALFVPLGEYNHGNKFQEMVIRPPWCFDALPPSPNINTIDFTPSSTITCDTLLFDSE